MKSNVVLYGFLLTHDFSKNQIIFIEAQCFYFSLKLTSSFHITAPYIIRLNTRDRNNSRWLGVPKCMNFHTNPYNSVKQCENLHTNPYTHKNATCISSQGDLSVAVPAFEDENIVCRDWINHSINFCISPQKFIKMVHPIMIMTNYIFIRKSENGHRRVTEAVEAGRPVRTSL